MLELVKNALRISTSDEGILSEVTLLIEAAKMDLKTSGVKKEIFDVEDDDLPHLIKLAITVYCKANFGLDNPERESLMESYYMLEKAITMSSEYGDNNEK